MKRKFRVVARKEVIYTVEIDDSLTPDEEWRSVFYPYYTLGEMAEHIVYNMKIKRFAFIEGIGPSVDNRFSVEVVEDPGWEFDTSEAK